jgi:serine/threonine-protein kinase
MEPGNEGRQPCRPALDAGLRAGFAGRSVIRDQSSVLQRLAARTNPPAGVARPASTGRYQVVDEIARGGVGIVQRCHDVDLGRDVAMKLLREDRLGDVSVLNRFVDEARIGGQLEHPGIVPIYDVGLEDDQRPYFTMKLVQGRTLSSLLAERRDVTQDRPRFLQVFLQVCQTVAYAQSKGVIHRDLKPANIMVGAFGEVQVVDWGLAKMLPKRPTSDLRSPIRDVPDGASGREGSDPVASAQSRGVVSASGQSECGDVMGTPAYMPPEQAQGDVARLDERADVFSLGAILCELLTGEPPYPGDREAALRGATQAELIPALDRLATCGGEPELISLCRRCLSVARADRPRDASEVAALMGSFLSRTAERAEVARLDAAVACGRADQERRARRLTVALAAAILLAVVVGAGALWRRSDERRLSERLLANRVGEMNLELAVARETNDAAAWDAVRAAAKPIEALLAAGNTGTDAEADAQAAIGNARLLAQQQSERVRLLERLDEIETDVEAPKWPCDLATLDRSYAACFREFGFEVAVLAPDAAAAGIRGRFGSSESLVSAVEDWAMIRRRVRDAEGVAYLLTVADALDFDDLSESRQTRRKLREAIRGQDSASLEALATEEATARLDRPTLVLLARALRSLRSMQKSREVLEVAWRRYPDDFVVSFELGELLASPEHARPREALACLRVAEALRKSCMAVRYRIGVVHYSQLREPEQAIEVFRDALAVQPGNWGLHLQLAEALNAASRPADAKPEFEWLVARDPQTEGQQIARMIALLDLGKYAEGVVAGREAVAAYPESPRLRLRYAQCLGREEQYDAAIEQNREALRIDPDSPDSVDARLGLFNDLLYWKHALSEARAVSEEGLRHHPDQASLRSAHAQACRASGDIQSAISESRAAIELQPKSSNFRVELGNTWIMASDWNAATKAYQEAVQMDEDDITARICFGVALDRIGEHGGAIAQLRDAVARAPDVFWKRQRGGYPANAHFALAVVLQSNGELEAAAAEFRATLSVAPGINARASEALAQTLFLLGDRSRSIDAAMDALVGRADEADQPVALLRPWFRNDAIVDAIRVLHREVEVDPDDVRATCNLCMLLRAAGDLDGAREVLSRSGSDDQILQLQRIAILLEVGDTASAVQLAREHLRMAADPISARRMLGLALQQSGDIDGAVEQFELSRPHAWNSWPLLRRFARLLREVGRFDAALVELRMANEVEFAYGVHALARDSELDEAERLVEAAKVFDAADGSAPDAASPDDALRFGEVALARGRALAAAKYFASAFGPAIDNTNATGPVAMRLAAGAAAMTASGSTPDSVSLGESERRRWTLTSVTWLNRAIELLRIGIESNDVFDRGDALGELRRWRVDARLSGIRDARFVEAEVAEDRSRIQELWTRVDELMREGADRAAEARH